VKQEIAAVKMENAGRIQVCGQRYRQRQAAGKAGWADETSYAQKRDRVDAILASGRLSSPCRFLELGCGNGNVALYVAQKGHAAYGVDLVPEAIAWAKEQAAQQKLHADFTVGSVVTLSAYGDDFFDVVFDANCLFMIIGKDREACVASVHRVLRPGGIFYAETHLVNEQIKQRMVFSGQDYFDPEGQYSTVQGQPMYYYSREQKFVDLIEGAGFQILRRETNAPQSTHRDMPFFAGGMWVEATKPE
jgi:SAM-dependent methyltransferase